MTGSALPGLTVRPSLDDLIGWSDVAGDDTAFHLDMKAARDLGFERAVVHGPWKAAVLMRILTEWAGPRGEVRRLSCEYRRPDYVGDELHFGGAVVSTHSGTEGTLTEFRLWVTTSAGTESLVGQATVHVATVQDSVAAGLPIEEVRRAVRLGEVAGTFTYRVEANDVERFVEAVTGDRPESGEAPEIAPATFFAALDPVERRDLDLDGALQHLPFPMVGGGNAFNEVEYERPIRVGDVVTVATTYTDVYEKDGSAGRLLFRVRTNELRDASGELVARTRSGHVLAFDLASPGAAKEDR